MLGLACGDALGRPVEFQGPDQIERTAKENTSYTLGAQYRVELNYDPGEPDAKGTRFPPQVSSVFVYTYSLK